MWSVESIDGMSLPSDPGSSGPETAPCQPTGPLDPGRSVVRAVECNSARYVDLVRDETSARPTSLILTDTKRETTPLSETDLCRVPELQNAVAFYGPETKSVRIRTRKRRASMLREYVDSLRERPENAFGFEERRFDFHVVG